MAVVPLSLQARYGVKKTEDVFLASGLHLGCVRDAALLFNTGKKPGRERGCPGTKEIEKQKLRLAERNPFTDRDGKLEQSLSAQQ